MIRRALFVTVGLGAGVVLGVWMVRKVERVQRELSPAHLARRAGTGAAGLADRVTSALGVAREAAAAREAELREHFNLAG